MQPVFSAFLGFLARNIIKIFKNRILFEKLDFFDHNTMYKMQVHVIIDGTIKNENEKEQIIASLKILIWSQGRSYTNF